MIFKILSALTAMIGICLVFELTPESITDGIISFLKPKNTVSARSNALRGRAKEGIYTKLLRLKETLAATGKTKSFSVAVTASFALVFIGAAAAVIIKNMFLLPVLCAAFGCIPFLYLSGILSAYEKQLDDEMETTLSAVTNSYLRSEDIIGAVRENLKYIKPPLYSVFKSFLNETESISADTKSALLNMADKTQDGIFREWVETLVRCQDDRSLSYGGKPEYITADKIPDCHIAFLDELFKSNEGVLNSLLKALNERVYTNEGRTVNIPVISFISASNEIPNFKNPEERILKALYDRFDCDRVAN